MCHTHTHMQIRTNPSHTNVAIVQKSSFRVCVCVCAHCRRLQLHFPSYAASISTGKKRKKFKFCPAFGRLPGDTANIYFISRMLHIRDCIVPTCLRFSCDLSPVFLFPLSSSLLRIFIFSNQRALPYCTCSHIPALTCRCIN